VKESTIGPAAGLGLFVRASRQIPQGCIFCEYRGRQSSHQDKDGLYVVFVRLTNTYIDGISSEGTHLSLATFINDNGPEHMNAGMTEYSRHAGRVFLVAARDIFPGEEVFVMYGPKYWGLNSYRDIAGRRAKKSGRSEEIITSPSRVGASSSSSKKRHRDAHQPTAQELPLQHCRSCKDSFPSRAASLHYSGECCGDSLKGKKVQRLDCLPVNPFTFTFMADRIAPSRRLQALHAAESLVDISDPQTFAHTHMDIVGEREFLFQDAS